MAELFEIGENSSNLCQIITAELCIMYHHLICLKNQVSMKAVLKDGQIYQSTKFIAFRLYQVWVYR